MSFRDALNKKNDDLDNFDAAGGDDLAAFDAATGQTHIPGGKYVCTVVRGEVALSKQAKQMYRLCFEVSEGEHRGFRLWRHFTFGTQAAANYAKKMLAPLGLKTAADLRKTPFPEAGRVITVEVLVTVQDDEQYGTRNNVERFEVRDDRTAPPNRNAVDLDKLGAEGAAP